MITRRSAIKALLAIFVTGKSFSGASMGFSKSFAPCFGDPAAIYQTPSLELEDLFTTPAVAPLGTPLAMEPGGFRANSWNTTDGSNKFSKAAGSLHLSGSTNANQPRIVSSVSFPRAAGRCYMARHTVNLIPAAFPSAQHGWTLNSNGTAINAFAWSVNRVPVTVSRILPIVANGVLARHIRTELATYTLAVVDLNPGALFYIKGGAQTDWFLAGVTSHVSGDTAYYPAFGCSTATTNTTLNEDVDWIKQSNLSDAGYSIFQREFGPYDYLLSGIAPQGTTFNHPTQGHIRFGFDALPVTTLEMRFRIVDASNYYKLTLTNSGGGSYVLNLYSVSSGTPSAVLATFSGALSGTPNFTLLINGTSVETRSQVTGSGLTYESASLFVSSNGFELTTLGGAVIRNLRYYDMNASGEAVLALRALEAAL